MKSIARMALFCLGLAVLSPFAALADDGDSTDEARAVANHGEAAVTPLATASADPAAVQTVDWMTPPEWMEDKTTAGFGFCQGPPALSCQCGIGLGEPGSEACCYCNTCWDGYVLALCGLDP